jgi:hypothetical protein
MTLVKHKDGRTGKMIWFYMDEENTTVSPYFFKEEDALKWKLETETNNV